MSKKKGAGRRRHMVVPNAGFAKVQWLYLPKMGGKTFARSGVEADGLLELEYLPEVARMDRNDLTMEERVAFSDLGRMPAENHQLALLDGSAYTPDIRMVLRSGEVVWVELGPHAEKFGKKNRQRLLAAIEAAQAEGAGYCVVTERVRRSFRIPNIQKLHAHRVGFLAVDEEGRTVERSLRERAFGILERTETGLTVPAVAAQLGEEQPREMREHCVWAALAEALAQDRVLPASEIARYDLGTLFRIVDPPSGPSEVERMMQGLDAEPVVDADADEGFDPIVVSLETLPDDVRAETLRRLAVVKDREAHPEDDWDRIARRHKVKRHQATYYWKLYTDPEDGGERALIPVRRKGRGVRGHPDVLAMIGKLRRLSDAIAVHGDKRLQAVMRRTGSLLSVRQVRRHLRALKIEKPLTRKEGTPPAIGPYRGDPDWRRAPFEPNEAWDVDVLHLDVRVQGDATGIVLPGIDAVVIFDVATKVPLAVEPCLWTPREIDYRRALIQAMTGAVDEDERELVEQMLGTPTFPFHGLPRVVTGDRGWIFTAKRVRDDLIGFGVRCETGAPYQPTMRANGERYHRSLNTFLHRLPGTTLSGDRRRPEHIVREEAARDGLTVSQLRRAIRLFNLTEYLPSPHRGLNYLAPQDVWREREERYGVTHLPDTEAMRLRLRLFSYVYLGTRTYDPRGYHFYDWFRPLGESARVADLLGDPDDIRLVAVCARDGREQAQSYLGDAYSVTLKDCDTPVTLDELRAILRTNTPVQPRARAQELLDSHVKGKRLSSKEAAHVERFVRKSMRSSDAPAVVRPSEAYADLELPRRSVFVVDQAVPATTEGETDNEMVMETNAVVEEEVEVMA